MDKYILMYANDNDEIVYKFSKNHNFLYQIVLDLGLTNFILAPDDDEIWKYSSYAMLNKI